MMRQFSHSRPKGMRLAGKANPRFRKRLSGGCDDQTINGHQVASHFPRCRERASSGCLREETGGRLAALTRWPPPFTRILLYSRSSSGGCGRKILWCECEEPTLQRKAQI